MKFLDCTLRDGGYYTNWDFDHELVVDYLTAMEQLPVDIVEVGYRSNVSDGYTGEYYHVPEFRLREIRKLAPSKTIAVMLNEAEVKEQDLETCLDPVLESINMVRLAVKPERFQQALKLAQKITERGLKVAFNLMYLSKVARDPDLISVMKELDGEVDCFSLVDSYGGVYPQEVNRIFGQLRPLFSKSLLGFHGHNNLELAFANSLAAVQAGCDMVDGTVTGMGRGAGNLRTELWLTWLATEQKKRIDFNSLSTVTEQFERMQKEFHWGTTLAYMVSGASSLPQKDVMDWMANRSYSLNSIVRALNNQKEGLKDNEQFPVFAEKLQGREALIIGGGPSVRTHIHALRSFIQHQSSRIFLVHASATNARHFQDLQVPQYFCLVGNEGYRLEQVMNGLKDLRGKCVLPPFPRVMGTYVPQKIHAMTHELERISFTDQYHDSHTALAIQTARDLGADGIWIAGYDGYEGRITLKEQELFRENEYLFNRIQEQGLSLTSLTPTRYKDISQASIYCLLMQNKS